MDLILASASPRRIDLLRQIGIKPSKVIPANVDESSLRAELPRDLALRLACAKAQEIAKNDKNSYILAADTVVAVGRRSLPKTEDEQSAKECLQLLSGRSHRVYGGISLITPEGGVISRCVETRVTFKNLSNLEIQSYLKSREWSGIAGGYAIQGRAAAFISKIQGSYSNVVGLSLYDTMNMLQGAAFPALDVS